MRFRPSKITHAPRAATVTAFSTYLTGLCISSHFPQLEMAFPLDVANDRLLSKAMVFAHSNLENSLRLP